MINANSSKINTICVPTVSVYANCRHYLVYKEGQQFRSETSKSKSIWTCYQYWGALWLRQQATGNRPWPQIQILNEWKSRKKLTERERSTARRRQGNNFDMGWWWALISKLYKIIADSKVKRGVWKYVEWGRKRVKKMGSKIGGNWLKEEQMYTENKLL